jgi:hypothetical protein
MDPILQEGKFAWCTDGWHRLGEGGLGRIGVERKDGDQELPLPLHDDGTTGGEGAAVSNPIDGHLDGPAWNPGLDEVRVQRIGNLAIHRRARSQQRLCHYLSSEHPIETVRLSLRSKSIGAHQLKPERTKQAVEGGQRGPVERGFPRAQRPGAVGCFGAHGVHV